MPKREIELCREAIANTAYCQDLVKSMPDETDGQRTRKALKLFLKVWSGFSKSIRHQVDQGRSFSAPFLGRFLKQNWEYKYIPSLEILEAGGLKLADGSKSVLSPFEAKDDQMPSAMSASAIANVVNCARNDVLHILKDIFLRVIENLKLGQDVDLDVKIGLV